MKRKNNKSNEFLTSVALIVIGLLFLIYKGGIISIAMSVIGVTLIALGIIDIIRNRVTVGIIKLVLAALVMLAGWLFIKLALYLLGAILLIVGVTELRSVLSVKYNETTNYIYDDDDYEDKYDLIYILVVKKIKAVQTFARLYLFFNLYST